MDDVSAKPGQNAVMTCQIYGYPASTVKWAFIPCSKPEFDSESCDESKKIKYVSGVEIDFELDSVWFPFCFICSFLFDYHRKIGHGYFYVMHGNNILFCMFTNTFI